MRILLFVLTLGGSLASDALPSAHLGPPSLGFRSPGRSVCKPIPSTLSLCHGIGYRHMRLPNLLGHDSLREAQQQSAAWLPLVSKLCHRDTRKFLCSLFAPVCVADYGGPVSPCRSLCEAVRDHCVPVMSAFGFPWPEMFNCSRFPRFTQLCIPPSGEQDARTAEVFSHEEALKGSVICDACSLAAEGETDIQDDFCESPYAFKMRLGSVSKVGGDRQLVPLPRSRILRWAGGGAERAGVGGATAHNALWLQEGGTCACPGLDFAAGELADKRANGVRPGWYLALAKAEEGRLVLTRLVLWTRGDKELKKFIRNLLKQHCPELSPLRL
ncbi:secreted frizzled-related protein 2-like [Syngnathoides biaculeatus]|uniref:secreted frizzled-related protein 2-like n=1 Tax=Syngnathoides biaculeatus TaxID=300417 RepID=UPI002ADE0BC4|nr:secreted frizzled-related protein 2-like [Syngnathoides biaculeatus]